MTQEEILIPRPQINNKKGALKIHFKEKQKFKNYKETLLIFACSLFLLPKTIPNV